MSTSASISARAPSLNVFDKSVLEKIAQQDFFEHEPDRYKERIKNLLKSSPKRPLCQVQDTHINAVKKLTKKMPHFSEVIELITDHLILSRMSRHQVLELPPIAIGGPPGLGKTFFVQKLAAILGCSAPLISCGDTNGDFIITGLDKGYSSSYPGKIAEHFELGGEANPLFILDEFEKPRPNHHTGGSFHDGFYTLLEKSSAHRFEDQYYKINFDASRINWLCTVNDFDLVPEPIRDRVHYVEIRQPSRDEMNALILSIYESVLAQYKKSRGLAFYRKPGADILTTLTEHTPRQVKKIIESACAKAARRKFENEDHKIMIPAVQLEAEDFKSHYGFRDKKPSFGFIQ